MDEDLCFRHYELVANWDRTRYRKKHHRRAVPATDEGPDEEIMIMSS